MDVLIQPPFSHVQCYSRDVSRRQLNRPSGSIRRFARLGRHAMLRYEYAHLNISCRLCCLHRQCAMAASGESAPWAAIRGICLVVTAAPLLRWDPRTDERVHPSSTAVAGGGNRVSGVPVAGVCRESSILCGASGRRSRRLALDRTDLFRHRKKRPPTCADRNGPGSGPRVLIDEPSACWIGLGGAKAYAGGDPCSWCVSRSFAWWEVARGVDRIPVS